MSVERLPLSPDELAEHWTVRDDEKNLVAGKRGPTKLGFAQWAVRVRGAVGCQIADYLDQHGRHARHAQLGPPPLSDALAVRWAAGRTSIHNP